MTTFTEKDLQKIAEKGLDKSIVEEQLKRFETGYPFLKINKASTINNGIRAFKDKKALAMVKTYEKLGKRKKKVKFVPASGAASRMFKELFEVLNNYENTKEDYLKIVANRDFGSPYYIIQNINKFAFFNDLQQAIEKNGSSFEEIKKVKDIPTLLKNLLSNEGLNYGNLPKGLLKFHRNDDEEKTPFEEHLIEGALYANTGKMVNLHFTVSEEHLLLFNEHLNQIKEKYEKKYKVNYNVSFSTQKQSTDTISVDLKNKPFRDKNGSLVFRPGGHGALIQNLNDIDADIIFIKNIDNVLQDILKEDTIIYKKVLAGVLLEVQKELFEWVKKLNKKSNEKYIKDALIFLRKSLNIIVPSAFNKWKEEKKVSFLLEKLNRPLRICGMVRNEGEPGGGPFWVENADGTLALQIVEGSQIPEGKKDLINKATHFNPVDIVCSIKNYKGEKFDLNDFIDNETGFISTKSYEGKELKALELPGLWNGAMSNWNTVFVEVPATTFSPVKTLGDLLKKEHLYEKDLVGGEVQKIFED